MRTYNVMKFLSLPAMLIISLFSACSRGEIHQQPDSCSTVELNWFVYHGIMTDTYYWYGEVPVVDWESYPSPAELLEDIKYKELDRWSYITTAASHTSLFKEGKYLGVGFGSQFDQQDNCVISVVYQSSPTDRAGLIRGDKILEINGKTIQEINSEDLWGTITGADEEGVEVTLKIEHSNQSIQEYTLQKTWITINTVLHSDVIQQNDKKIGYLVFMSFLETSFNELDTAFSFLKVQGVDELILDLRYNGGGLLNVATSLAGLISGDHTAGEIFAQYIHNDNYTHWNDYSLFTNFTESLDLDKVVVITSVGTCSASESVINSLKPFVEVVTIGDTTCGKPVGMYPHEVCDLTISAIEFEIVNALGQGGYFDGIPATCQAEDGFTHPLGNTQEASLQEALYYLANDACSSSYAGEPASIPGRSKPVPLRGFRREIGAF